MKFTVILASTYEVMEETSIDTMKELKELYQQYNEFELIVDFKEMTITIYNDYIK